MDALAEVEELRVDLQSRLPCGLLVYLEPDPVVPPDEPDRATPARESLEVGDRQGGPSLNGGKDRGGDRRDAAVSATPTPKPRTATPTPRSGDRSLHDENDKRDDDKR